MLTHITVENVRHAYAELPNTFRHAERETSRNGDVLVLPGPLVTTYQRPTQRVLLDPERDANPFFHLMEAFWMLAGRRDVQSLMHYNAGMARYSDDGETFHGAYGHRWRRHFGTDQLTRIVDLLRHNPADRRIVLQMWDPRVDLGQEGLDFPCNNLCYFRVQGTVLDMTIVCRSNDMLWGGYGANAVHFSVLQEFMASMLGLAVGEMHQVSNNAHLYVEKTPDITMPYTGYEEITVPLFGNLSHVSPSLVLSELEDLWSNGEFTPRHLPETTIELVRGMRETWRGWKLRDSVMALSGLDIIRESGHEDWWVACHEWIMRRQEKFS